MVEGKEDHYDLEGFSDEEELTLGKSSLEKLQGVPVQEIPRKLTEGHAVRLTPHSANPSRSLSHYVQSGVLAHPIVVGRPIHFFPKERFLSTHLVCNIEQFGDNPQDPDFYSIRTMLSKYFIFEYRFYPHEGQDLLPISDLAFNKDFPFQLNRVEAPRPIFFYRFMDECVPASFLNHSFLVFQVFSRKQSPEKRSVDSNVSVFRVQGDPSATPLGPGSFLNFDFNPEQYQEVAHLFPFEADSAPIVSIREIYDYDSPTGTPTYRITDGQSIYYLVGEKSIRNQRIVQKILDWFDRAPILNRFSKTQ
jgi:hypothetical protein